MAGKLIGGRTAARALLAAAALMAGLAETAHAVTVSPTALYIDSRTRTATLTLYNPGSLPAEVSIDFAYGYPQSDAEGNVSVPLTREPAAGEPSAMDWMRAFPRRLVLQPGQRQVVRVLVEPPPELPDGEYWARVLVSSRGGQPPIENTQGDVQLQLNVQTTLVMAANFRKGAVGTGVEVARATAVRDGTDVNLEVQMQRTGNAAFLGRLRADVLDARGTVVATAWDDIAVYRTMLRRLAIALPEGTAGPLEVRLTIDTERQDLPPGGALPASTVTRSVAVAP
jgi:P pilus assembly chaperone PapD